MSGTIETDGLEALKSLGKRVRRIERRQVPQQASDLLGPGAAPRAVQIADWNDPITTWNGNYWSDTGALHSPDPAIVWTGSVIAKDNGSGMQQVWNTDDPDLTRYAVRTYRSDATGMNYLFTEWKAFASPSGYIGVEVIDPDYIESVQDQLDANAAAIDAAPLSLKIFEQGTEPAVDPLRPFQIGDVWIDTAHDRRLNVWNGTAWIDAESTLFGDLAADIAAIEAGLIDAADAAADAMNFAASRNRVFRQATEPTNPIDGYPLDDGDLWFDTDDSNRVRTWNGTAWVDLGISLRNEAEDYADAQAAAAQTAAILAAAADATTKAGAAQGAAIAAAASDATTKAAAAIVAASTYADSATAAAQAAAEATAQAYADSLQFGSGQLLNGTSTLVGFNGLDESGSTATYSKVTGGYAGTSTTQRAVLTATGPNAATQSYADTNDAYLLNTLRGQSAVFSAAIRSTDGGAGYAQVTFFVHTPSGWNSHQQGVFLPTDATWVRPETTWEVPADVDQIQLRMQVIHGTVVHTYEFSAPKLELGNRATGWSPSFTDAELAADAARVAATAAAAADATTKANAAQSAATAAAATDATTKAAAAQAAAYAASTSYTDSVKVGAVNLLDSSGFFPGRQINWSNAYHCAVTYTTPPIERGVYANARVTCTTSDPDVYAAWAYQAAQDLPRSLAGKQVTVSFTARADSARNVSGPAFQGDTYPWDYAGTPNFAVTTTPQRFSLTTTMPAQAPDDTAYGFRMLLRLSDTAVTSGQWVEYSAIKVEVGSKGTDWSPSAADVTAFAQAAADAAEAAAVATAAADATAKANAAQTAAIAAASADATTKAGNAQSAAISAAASDATTKAAAAQAAAISAAASAASTAYGPTTSLVNSWKSGADPTKIDGGDIAANTVVTNALAATAIDGMTITGALFQTESTASRGIKITTSGLTAYNGSGTPTLVITASTGAITMLGDLTSGSTVTGAVVTGGTVQTEATASRGIKMTSGGLTAYDGSGTPTVTINASTGAVTIKGELAVGSVIHGQDLVAGSVTVEKIVVGTMGDELIVNGNFAQSSSTVGDLPAGWSQDGSNDVRLENGTGYKQLVLEATPSTTARTVSRPFPVQGGEQYAVEALLSYVGAAPAAYVRMNWYTDNPNGSSVDNQNFSDGNATPPYVDVASGNTLSGFATGNPTNAYRARSTFTAPANARWGAVSFYNFFPSAGPSYMLLFNVSVRKALVSTQIAEDGVTTTNLKADAITVKHTMIAPTYKTTSASSRGILINSSGLVAYDSVGTPTLTIDSATGSISMLGALTSGSTVTGGTVVGGTVRTNPVADGNRGVVVTTGGLTAYDGSGNPTLTINASNGSISLANALVAGGTITGPTLQTTATASRGIKITTSSLIAYNGSGTQTFSIDASTGAVVMLGSLTSGSDISGATVTGGTVQTSSSASTGIKINSSGLTAYNGSGSPVLTIVASTGAITLDGALSALSISGGTVTGALLQSTVTASRGVKMTSGGLVGYNGSGTQTFLLDAATGVLTVAGGVLTSGSVTGAVVTGGTVQTSSSASTGIKISSAGLVAYGSGSAKLTIDGSTGDVVLAGNLTGAGTITGPIFQTASGTSSERIVIRNDGSGGVIEAFSGLGSTETPSVFDPSTTYLGAAVPTVTIKSGSYGTYVNQPRITMYTTNVVYGQVEFWNAYVSFKEDVSMSKHFYPTGTGWQNISLLSNYVAFGGGFNAPQYKRVGWTVKLRGLVTRTFSTATAPQTINTALASTERPSAGCIYEQHLSGSRCRVDVETAGNIRHMDTALGVGGYLSLDGIEFDTN